MTAASANVIEVHHYHHFPEASSGHGHGISAQLAFLGNTLMTVSDAVAELLTLAQENQTLVGSVSSVMQALNVQLAAQSAQITQLQAQLAAGGTIGPDDLAAIATSTADLQASVTQLQADIPTNVTTVGTQASAAPAPDPTKVAAAASQHEEDSAAAAKAQPLSGTEKPTS